MPEGPEMPPSMLGPAGSPSSTVRRARVLRSMSETRPLFGPSPPSATSRFPLGVMTSFEGALSPPAKTETDCARAAEEARAQESAATVKRVLNFMADLLKRAERVSSGRVFRNADSEEG